MSNRSCIKLQQIFSEDKNIYKFRNAGMDHAGKRDKIYAFSCKLL